MSAINNTATLNQRMFRIGILAVLAIVVLAGAAYLWGSRLDADTLQANTQRSSEASAARYGSSFGISAVRAADASASQASLAARYGSSLGISAVRAADASASSAPRYGHVLGVSAVRAADVSASRGSNLQGVAAVRAVD
jgi:hypothetical protein